MYARHACVLQAKELLDHLEGVLSNEPVSVSSGVGIVEVKPQGVSKGGAVERILLQTADEGAAPDFILCIGDDRSDEDMFAAIDSVAFSPHHHAAVSYKKHPDVSHAGMYVGAMYI